MAQKSVLTRNEKTVSIRRGEVLKKIMEEKGCQVPELANYCNVSDRTVIRWRQGNWMDNEHLSSVCNYLDINEGELNPRKSDYDMNDRNILF